jgi:phage-related protein
MSDVLPPLVLELKAKSDQLTAELTKVKGQVADMTAHTQANTAKAGGFFESMSGSIKSAGSALMGTLGAVAAPLAAIGAGLAVKSIVDDSIKQFEALAGSIRTVQRIAGGSVEQVSEMTGAMKLAGVNAEDVTGSITIFEKKLGNTQGDAAAMSEMTDKLGQSFTDAAGNIKPMAELLPGLADKFKAMPDGAEKTALATDLFGRSGAAMIPVLNKGSAGLEELTQKAKEMGLTMDDASMKAFLDSKKSAREFNASIDGLKTTLGSDLLPVVDAVQNIFRQALGPAIKGVTGFLKDHREEFQQVGDKIQGFADKVGPAVSNAFGKIGELLKPVIDSFSGMGGSFGPLIGQFVALAGAFSPIHLIFEAIKPVLPAVVDAVVQLASTLGGALGSALQAIMPALVEVAKTFSGLLAENLTNLIPPILELVKVLGPILGEVIKQLAPVISELATSLGGTLAETLTTLAPVVADLVKMLAESLGETIKQLAPVIIDLVKVLGPIFGKVLGELGPIIGELAKVFVEIIKAVMPLVPVILELVMAFLPLLQPIMDLISNLLPPLIDLLLPLIKIMIDFGQNVLKNIVIPILLWLVDVIIDLAKGFADMVKGVVEGAKQFVEWLADAFSDIGKKVGDLWNGMVSGITDNWKRVTDFFGGIGKTVGDFFSGAGQWLYDAGKNLIDGLFQGINSVAGSIGSFFLNVIPDWIREPFKAALGIHSPSTVFAGFGANIGQGLVGGINSTVGAVKKATEGMSSIVSDSFNGSLGVSIAGVGGSFVSPIVRPVVQQPQVSAAEQRKMAETSQSKNVTVNVTANTNANPYQIASTVGWQLRQMG